MSEIDELQSFESRINEIKLKNIASENEIKRLTDELEKKKQEIKETYNVEIEDFSNAIEIMKEEYNNKANALSKSISDAEQQLGVKHE